MKFACLLFFFCLVFCHKDKKESIFFNPNLEKIDSISFQYGPEQDSIPAGSPFVSNQVFSWNHGNDLALKASFRFQESLETTEFLSAFQKILTANEASEYFPKGSLTLENGEKIQFDFVTSNGILNGISENVKFILLGDEYLESELGEREFVFSRNSASNPILRSKELRGISLVVQDNECKFYFPISSIDLPRNRRRYLEFLASCNPEKLHELQTKLRTLPAQLQLDCKEIVNPLKLTEAYLGSDGIAKFLEFQNENSHSVCISEIRFGRNFQSKLELEKVLPPNSVFVLKEKSGNLEGFSVPESFWKELAKDSSRLLFRIDKQVFDLSISNHRFSEEGEFFSWKQTGKSCLDLANYRSSKKICADPGTEDVFFPTRCDLDFFELSELDTFGEWNGSSFDTSGKFVELKNLSPLPCRLNGLSLRIGERRSVPLRLERDWRPNETIVLSNHNGLSQEKSTIRRSLREMVSSDKITVHDRISNRTKDLYVPSQPSEQFLSLDSQKIHHSMVWNAATKRFLHHMTPQGSSLWNAKSPGFPNPDSGTLTTQVQISELFTNSRVGTNPKPWEFLEIIPSKVGSFEIELSGKKLLAFTNDPRYPIVIDNQESVCKDVPGIALNDSLFVNGLNQIRVGQETRFFEKTNLSQSIVYDPEWGNLFHSINPRFTFLDCPGIFASPGVQTVFSPFFREVAEKIFVISTQTDWGFSKKLTVQRLSKPSLDFFVLLQNSLDITNFLEQGSESSYAYLEDTNEFFFYSQPKLFIAGSHPTPTNSQNEWVMVCNFGKSTQVLSSLEIEDESSIDTIVPWNQRNPGVTISGNANYPIHLQNSSLEAKTCGIVLDPDARTDVLFPELPQGFSSSRGLSIFTIAATSTIGNGISSDEFLDLWERKGTERNLLSSYGHRHSRNPFRISLERGEYSLLESSDSTKSQNFKIRN